MLHWVWVFSCLPGLHAASSNCVFWKCHVAINFHVALNNAVAIMITNLSRRDMTSGIIKLVSYKVVNGNYKFVSIWCRTRKSCFDNHFLTAWSQWWCHLFAVCYSFLPFPVVCCSRAGLTASEWVISSLAEDIAFKSYNCFFSKSVAFF